MKEALASLCHEQWSGWMRYLFEKGTFNKDGSWTMPSNYVTYWLRQMTTPYSQLSDTEQDSDKKEAERILELFNSQHKQCKCKEE